MTDFDNGRTRNDGFAFWGVGPADAIGKGVDEGMSAGGDSGGPHFVPDSAGVITGVTSYGITFIVGIRPFQSDVNNFLDSSFGEFGGDTRVSFYTDFIDGVLASKDSDGDGVPDIDDICAGFDDAIDTDGDGVPDGCDICPNDNPNDSDGDGVCESNDICPGFDDAIDTDGDSIPDGCDAFPNDPNNDIDGDLVSGEIDNCPNTPNAGQENLDGDSVGDACDPNTMITTNTVLAADTTLSGDLTVDGATLTISAGITLDVDFINNKILIKFPDSKILIESGGKIT